jgi:hypothetical protein
MRQHSVKSSSAIEFFEDDAKKMSVEECSKLIVEAIDKKKKNVVLTLSGKLGVYCKPLLPGMRSECLIDFRKVSCSILQNAKPEEKNLSPSFNFCFYCTTTFGCQQPQNLERIDGSFRCASSRSSIVKKDLASFPALSKMPSAMHSSSEGSPLPKDPKILLDLFDVFKASVTSLRDTLPSQS